MKRHEISWEVKRHGISWEVKRHDFFLGSKKADLVSWETKRQGPFGKKKEKALFKEKKNTKKRGNKKKEGRRVPKKKRRDYTFMLFFTKEGNSWKKEVTRACKATKRGEQNASGVWFSWWKGHNVVWICRIIWFAYLFVSILYFCKHAYTSSFFLFLFTLSHVTSEPPKTALKQHQK